MFILALALLWATGSPCFLEVHNLISIGQSRAGLIITATREIKQDDVRQSVAGKGSPRLGSGALCLEEAWEGEWPGPGEAGEGRPDVGPNNDCRPLNV